MHTSIRRQLHLCPRGRAAAAWCGTLILALAPAATSAGAATVAKPTAAKTPPPTPPLSCANTGLQPTAANLAEIDARATEVLEKGDVAAYWRIHDERLTFEAKEGARYGYGKKGGKV